MIGMSGYCTLCSHTVQPFIHRVVSRLTKYSFGREARKRIPVDMLVEAPATEVRTLPT